MSAALFQVGEAVILSKRSGPEALQAFTATVVAVAAQQVVLLIEGTIEDDEAPVPAGAA